MPAGYRILRIGQWHSVGRGRYMKESDHSEWAPKLWNQCHPAIIRRHGFTKINRDALSTIWGRPGLRAAPPTIPRRPGSAGPNSRDLHLKEFSDSRRMCISLWFPWLYVGGHPPRASTNPSYNPSSLADWWLIPFFECPEKSRLFHKIGETWPQKKARAQHRPSWVQVTAKFEASLDIWVQSSSL